MYQGVFVGVLEAQRGLTDQLAGIGDRQRPATPHQFRQIDAVHVLHHQDRRAVDLTRVVRLDDIRMPQPPGSFHLAIEACDREFVIGPALGQNLQGHHAVQMHVQGLEDGAHAAFAQLCQELVFTDLSQVWDLFFGNRRQRDGRSVVRLPDGRRGGDGPLAFGRIQVRVRRHGLLQLLQ